MLTVGAFRTSTLQSLCVETNEAPLEIRRTRLSFQYCVELISNEVNPAYSTVFQYDIVATYAAKERIIKLLGLMTESHLDEVGFHPHVSTQYKTMKTPPWNLSCIEFTLNYVNTRRVILIQLYIVIIILNCWILLQIIHFFTDGS